MAVEWSSHSLLKRKICWKGLEGSKPLQDPTCSFTAKNFEKQHYCCWVKPGSCLCKAYQHASSWTSSQMHCSWSAWETSLAAEMYVCQEGQVYIAYSLLIPKAISCRRSEKWRKTSHSLQMMSHSLKLVIVQHFSTVRWGKNKKKAFCLHQQNRSWGTTWEHCKYHSKLSTKKGQELAKAKYWLN